MTDSDNFHSSHTRVGQYAEQVLYNGRFYTLNPAQPWADAVAIREGRFVAGQYTGQSFVGRLTRRGVVMRNGFGHRVSTRILRRRRSSQS